MAIEGQHLNIAVMYDEIKVPAQDAPAPPVERPTPEQIKAAEQLFSQQSQEAEQVQGLMGMWISVAMLHDLAFEHFTAPVGKLEEEERREKQKPKLPRKALDSDPE